jgi:hypothetical protein
MQNGGNRYPHAKGEERVPPILVTLFLIVLAQIFLEVLIVPPFPHGKKQHHHHGCRPAIDKHHRAENPESPMDRDRPLSQFEVEAIPLSILRVFLILLHIPFAFIDCDRWSCANSASRLRCCCRRPNHGKNETRLKIKSNGPNDTGRGIGLRTGSPMGYTLGIVPGGLGIPRIFIRSLFRLCLSWSWIGVKSGLPFHLFMFYIPDSSLGVNWWKKTTLLGRCEKVITGCSLFQYCTKAWGESNPSSL